MTKGEDKVTGILRNEIDDYGDITGDTFIEGGLTKREYFAGLCMQGVMGNSEINKGYSRPSDYAKRAVQQADALIEELNKEKK